MYKIKAWFNLCIFALTVVLSSCMAVLPTDNVAAVTELEIINNKVGTGAEAEVGNMVYVHYTGWLYNASAPDHKGRKFDSSLDRGKPFSFQLGSGKVIRGWDQGVAGMKIGGKRTLIIPPDMAYGARGAGNAIPPNATLIFDIELFNVQ